MGQSPKLVDGRTYASVRLPVVRQSNPESKLPRSNNRGS